MNVDLFGDPVVDTVQRDAVASALVRGWVARQQTRPSARKIQTHAKVAKRICQDHDPEAVMTAAVGIERVFPYKTGVPWDLFDLERHFQKAFAEGTSRVVEGNATSSLAQAAAQRQEERRKTR